MYHITHRKEKNGRPSLISDEGFSRIHQAVEEAELDKKALTKSEAISLLKEEVIRTAKERNTDIPDLSSILHNSTRLLEKAGIIVRTGQVTTEARWIAGRDIRNMVSMASMLHLYKDNPPQLMGNMDATRIHISFDEATELATTGSSRKENIPLTRMGTTSLGVAVKQYTLISASGHISLTFLMSEPSLNVEDFIHFSVPGLSISTGDPSFQSEICLCQTRNGNKSFYEYLFTVVVVNFARQLRGLVSASQAQSPFLLIIDGEVIQSEILQKPDVISKLVDENIVVGKGPASASGSCGNPADMGNLFKAQKGLVKHADELEEEYPGIVEKIMEGFKINSTNLLGRMPSERKKKISSAIIRTVKSSEKINNIKSVIQKGFELLGLYPYSITTTLKCCGVSIEEEELKQIELSIPKLSQLMKDNGQVTEFDMDNEHIPVSKEKEPEESPKDSRPQERQRAIILTHTLAVERRRAYLQKKEDEQKAIEQNKINKENERLKKEKEKADLKEAKEKAKLEKEEKRKKLEEEKKLANEAKQLLKLNSKRKLEEKSNGTKGKKIKLMDQKEPQNNDEETDSDEEMDEMANNEDVPLKLLPYIQILFDLVESTDGTHAKSAKAASIQILQQLLRNGNKVSTIRVKQDQMKSKQYWNDIFYNTIIRNEPTALELPINIVNPIEKWPQAKIDEALAKGATQRFINNPLKLATTVLLPAKFGKFPCPVPCLNGKDFNHIDRVSNFTTKDTQILKHKPRVSRGHMDHGFGWLYLVNGFKVFVYIKENNREPGSSIPPVQGCSLRDPWDFNILTANQEHVRYILMEPGQLVIVPPSVRHIVLSPVDCFAYGSYNSHIYGAIADLCNYLDLHRETHPDLPTMKDADEGMTVHQTSELASRINEFLAIPENRNIPKLGDIVKAKSSSLVSTQRRLQCKLTTLKNFFM
jgi:hypothetical protein